MPVLATRIHSIAPSANIAVSPGGTFALSVTYTATTANKKFVVASHGDVVTPPSLPAPAGANTTIQLQFHVSPAAIRGTRSMSLEISSVQGPVYKTLEIQ